MLGPLGSNGPDRITQNTYDAANQLTQVATGYLSSNQVNYAALTYTPNGLTKTVLDAASNLTTLVYDTYDRVSQVQFPMPTRGSDASNPSDYEGYGYDSNGNLTSKRLRSGDTVTFSYDALNRATSAVFPAGKSQTVYWGYDLLNRGLYARYGSASGPGVSYGYDALSRVTSETSVGKTLAYQYDAAGNRTRVTWPETGANALYVTYVYDVLNRVTQVEENGATSGPGLLASYGYDSLGRRSTLTRAGGAGAGTGYAYDGASRLYTLTQTLAGSASVTYTLGYNAANQVLTKQVSNGAYVAHPASLTAGYVANGLNQYTSVTGVTASYTPANSAALSYDPAGRLQTETTAGATTSLLYSGDALVGEYTSSGAIVSRYVMGPGVDEPLVWYQGAGTSTRRWLTADNQGSVIGYADGSGNSGATYTYGPYGEPIVSGGASAWGGSRYRFTGQIEIPEAQLYYYKARVYDPNLGRFYQTDPAGLASDTNLYAYATEDPVNGSDPSGMDPPVAPPQCENGCFFNAPDDFSTDSLSACGGSWTCGTNPDGTPSYGAPPFDAIPTAAPASAAFLWLIVNGGPQGSGGGGGGGGDKPQNRGHGLQQPVNPQLSPKSTVRGWPLMIGTLKNAALISTAYLILYGVLFAFCLLKWLAGAIGLKILLLSNPMVYFGAYAASFGRLDYTLYGLIIGCLISFLIAFVISTIMLSLYKMNRITIYGFLCAYLLWASYIFVLF